MNAKLAVLLLVLEELEGRVKIAFTPEHVDFANTEQQVGVLFNPYEYSVAVSTFDAREHEDAVQRFELWIGSVDQLAERLIKDQGLPGHLLDFIKKKYPGLSSGFSHEYTQFEEIMAGVIAKNIERLARKRTQDEYMKNHPEVSEQLERIIAPIKKLMQEDGLL